MRRRGPGRARLEVRTGSSFPGDHALGAVDDVALTEAVALELGRRLAACGVNLNWAPSADVNSNPSNPVIAGSRRRPGDRFPRRPEGSPRRERGREARRRVLGLQVPLSLAASGLRGSPDN